MSKLSRGTVLVAGINILLLGLLLGCEGRESLHEMDHVVPEHWPESIEDGIAKLQIVADKIRADESAAGADKAMHELHDLLSWIPEIAADTDMTEQQWNRIAEASANCLRLSEQEGWSSNVQKNLESVLSELQAVSQLTEIKDV